MISIQKCLIILETMETEEGRRDEPLRQVIHRISCRQRFGVAEERGSLLGDPVVPPWMELILDTQWRSK